MFHESRVSFVLCCSWSDFACRAFHVFPFLSLACVYVSHLHGLSPSARLQQCFNETQLGLCRLALRINFIHDFGASKCPDCRLSHCRCRETTYSLRGLNPRPMAHKTIALTIELRALFNCWACTISQVAMMLHTGKLMRPSFPMRMRRLQPWSAACVGL